MSTTIVDVVLTVALVALLVTWIVSTGRRRRIDRERRDADRRMIISALTREPRPLDEPASVPSADEVDPPRVDSEVIANLIAALEDRRPRHRGVLAGLLSSPVTAWSAGVRAGQHVSKSGGVPP